MRRYPLVGAAALAPAGPLRRRWRDVTGTGLVVEPLVLERLGVQAGAVLRLGRRRFTLRGGADGASRTGWRRRRSWGRGR